MMVVGAILVLCVPPEVTAQDVRVGLRAGPTFGFLNEGTLPFISGGGTPRGTPHARVDLHGGIFGLVSISDHVGLQSEVLFLRKGGHFSSLETVERAGPVYSSEGYQLSYLQTQLLARTDLSSFGPLSVHAVAGVSLDVALSGFLHRDVRTQRAAVDQRISLVDQYLVQRWGMGAVVGVSFGYPLRMTRRIALDVRYNPGFRSVFTGSRAPISGVANILDRPLPLMGSPPTVRHDVLTFGVSYTFSLRRDAEG